MSAIEPRDVMRDIFRGLQSLGYTDDLLHHNYTFADVLSQHDPVRTIPLVAFGQHPPSYRTACIAVINGRDDLPSVVLPYRALGAPQVFVVGADYVSRWKMTAQGDPQFLERVPSEQIVPSLQEHKHIWGPAEIMRAKSIAFSQEPIQLDFYDAGLVPEIDTIVKDKLDNLLNRTIAAVKAAHAEHSLAEVDYVGLFRLVFRLLTAKLMGDRGHAGPWASPKVSDVIPAVERMYFNTEDSPYLLPSEVQQVAWDRIKGGFHLQNVSVETLAHIYENTFVTSEMRKRYGIHGTPFEVANHVVQALPIEKLALEKRRVFEPFSGQAVFLISALARLRSLLPPAVAPEQAHAYFQRMLVGMEQDAFALEIARLSLMLADYPNSNGWQLLQGDVFSDPRVDREIAKSDIVLCNPPFERFPAEEHAYYRGLRTAYKPTEILSLVLDQPPEQLGFILPRTFVDGQSYRAIRRRLIATYNNIQITALPDIAFAHSQVETVVLTAFGTGHTRTIHVRSSQVEDRDYADFLRTGVVTWSRETEIDALQEGPLPSLWQPPLSEVWEALAPKVSLGDIAHIQRGVEYNVSLRKNRKALVSESPKEGYARGLLGVTPGFEPFLIRGHIYLNLAPELMLYKAHQLPWSEPKVVVNAARKNRGRWPIVAAPDETGLVCYQRFHGVWPDKHGLPIEVVAAVLNGPVANAYVSTHSTGRDIRKRVLAEIPIPDLQNRQIERVVELVRDYQRSVRLNDYYGVAPSLDEPSETMLQEVNAIILEGYDLDAELEDDLMRYLGATTGIRGEPHTVLSDFLPQETQDELLAKLDELGRQVYSPEGYAAFLNSRLQAFGGKSALELIEQGETERVLGALVADYEGLGY